MTKDSKCIFDTRLCILDTKFLLKYRYIWRKASETEGEMSKKEKKSQVKESIYPRHIQIKLEYMYLK